MYLYKFARQFFSLRSLPLKTPRFSDGRDGRVIDRADYYCGGFASTANYYLVLVPYTRGPALDKIYT